LVHQRKIGNSTCSQITKAHNVQTAKLTIYKQHKNVQVSDADNTIILFEF